MAGTILFRISRLPVYDCRELKIILHNVLYGRASNRNEHQGYLLGWGGGGGKGPPFWGVK